jgi:preprotein translocase subunit SecE
MNKLFSLFQTVKNFSNEVVGEILKSSWPTRQELIESTIVIIISVILLALFIGVSDKILYILLKLLIPTRGY